MFCRKCQVSHLTMESGSFPPCFLWQSIVFLFDLQEKKGFTSLQIPGVTTELRQDVLRVNLIFSSLNDH